MEKTKKYRRTRFSADTVREAVKKFEEIVTASSLKFDAQLFSVARAEEDWRFDNEEEFFASDRQAGSAEVSVR